MRITNAPARASYDFVADGMPVYVIDGKPLMKVAVRGKADQWQELPLSVFDPAQQAEIKRLAEWRALPRSEREERINKKLAAMVGFGL